MSSSKIGQNTGTKKSGSQQSGGGQRSSVTSMTGGPTSSYQSPMVLTPVSQLDKTPRKNSRTSQPDLGVKNMTLNPEDYNPDGSLRTVHRLPSFEQSYAQARNARYIRHNKVLERETELNVAQIFDKKN